MPGKDSNGNGKDNEAGSSLTVKTVTTYLRSASEYSQSKKIVSEKKPNEADKAWEERCWRERIHVNRSGKVFIPAMQFKRAIQAAAAMLNEKIPGKGNQTWSKQFKCGLIVSQGIELPLTPDEVDGEPCFLHTQPTKPNSGSTTKIMPRIWEWEGEMVWHITSPVITKEVFARYMEAAGMMIGIGRWRAEKGGCYGRFELVSLDWPE